MPTKKRPTLSITNEEMAFFKECHNKKRMRGIGASVKKTILDLEESNKKKDERIQELAQKFESGNPSPQKEQSTFNYEAVQAFCQYPYLDESSGKHVCGKLKRDDLIHMPNDRILTNEICGLCQEVSGKKILENSSVAEPTPNVCMQVQPQFQERKSQDSFDYDNWSCLCDFGTYIKEKKLVHCRCHYRSVLQWLPNNRMVFPQVCENCYEKVEDIRLWLEERRSEENKKFLNFNPISIDSKKS